MRGIYCASNAAYLVPTACTELTIEAFVLVLSRFSTTELAGRLQWPSMSDH